MTATYEMGDAAYPPDPPASLPVFAFYAGGSTPHVWTDAEINHIAARWVLPIWVNTDPNANAAEHATAIIDWLHAHHYERGETVVLDSESVPMERYLAELDGHLKGAGYPLMNYESKGPMPANPLTAGGRWVADWTGTPHLYEGSLATQYASDEMIGHPWDASLIAHAVPLHELHPPAVHHIPVVKVEMELPELGRGDTGAAVRRLQSLLTAWEANCLAPGHVDGIFGPVTATALARFQRLYGLSGDRGTATAATWQRLTEG
jgi:Putative peptidoglycan binding domain